MGKLKLHVPQYATVHTHVLEKRSSPISKTGSGATSKEHLIML